MKNKKNLEIIVDNNYSEEYKLRVEKVKAMREVGIEPWPELKKCNSNIKQLLEKFDDFIDASTYNFSGRIMSMRIHGKAVFLNIKDDSGSIQVYFKESQLGKELFNIFERFIDIGDIIWVSGTLFKTQKGEATLRAFDFVLQSKCLHPLPEKFHGLVDIEVIYRQRYLDLITNYESKEIFVKRSLIINYCSEFLIKSGYLSVETPLLQAIPGGALAKPFTTYHNALNSDLFLRISPELFLKKLIIGGFDKIFEIGRNFRNEGISTRHNPEFTMLEFYTAFQDYNFGMDFTEELLKYVGAKVLKNNQFNFNGHFIDFNKSFLRLTIEEAVQKYNNITTALNIEALDLIIKKNKLIFDDLSASFYKKLYFVFEETVESKLISPTFITGYPLEISPLSKATADNPEIAARAELFICGMEVANLYNELNDPFDQAERFKKQAEIKKTGDEEAHYFDTDFITALEYALPPTVGVGIGIERLTMLFTEKTSIKDVLLFPTLKKVK